MLPNNTSLVVAILVAAIPNEAIGPFLAAPIRLQFDVGNLFHYIIIFNGVEVQGEIT